MFFPIQNSINPGLSVREQVGLKDASKELRLVGDYGKIPLYFIPNEGQVHEKALFYSKTSKYTLWVTKEGLVFDSMRRVGKETSESHIKSSKDINKPNSLKYQRDASELVFLNSNRNPEIVPVDQTEHKVNYFIGNNKSKWRTNISTSRAILYRELYRNIDLKIYGIEKQIEYDYIVKPGGEVSDIRFKYKNIKNSKIDKSGNLIIKTEFGELMHKKPISYQIIAKKKIKVEVNFKKIGERSYRFRLGNYNKDFELVIDPVVLAYSSYLGGSDYDYCYGIAVDGSGCAYVTGKTHSPDFPTQYPYQEYTDDIWMKANVFITKFSSDGASLVYSTYLGGSNFDECFGIDVDLMGSAYLTGWTFSSDFPTRNAFQGNHAGGEVMSDAFVTKLSQDGSSIVYSTYLGGSQADRSNAIAVDDNGYAYVTGWTYSTDFPIQAAYQAYRDLGSKDAFVTKFSSDGTSAVYSTYIGSGSMDRGEDIVVDASGSAYITGGTWGGDFPIKGAYQTDYRGGVFDAFVTKFSPNGASLDYSTYLGGNGWDIGYSIFLDNNGSAYITGRTGSFDFPTKNAFQGTHNGGRDDLFVTKFSPEGDSIEYSTYLGGDGWDVGFDIAVDSSGSAYIIGRTFSSNFPLNNPFKGSDPSGYDDAFIACFSSDGSSLVFSTYFGGSYMDAAHSIAVDNAGSAYISGITWSSDFPTQNAFQGFYAGDSDVFVAKIYFTGSSTGFETNNNSLVLREPSKEIESSDVSIRKSYLGRGLSNRKTLTDQHSLYSNPEKIQYPTERDTLELKLNNAYKSTKNNISNQNQISFSYEKERLKWDPKRSWSNDPHEIKGSQTALGDIDNDGDIDIVFTGLTIEGDRHGSADFPANEVVIFINDGNGYFNDETDVRIVSSRLFDAGGEIKLGDVDSDGDLDLLLGYHGVEYAQYLPGSQDKILINNGKGFFKDETSIRLPIEENTFTHCIAFGDVDNDEDLDIIAGRLGAEPPPSIHSELWINNGEGVFSVDESFSHLEWTGISGVNFGDLNGDNYLDIVALGSEVHILINDKEGGFDKIENGPEYLQGAGGGHNPLIEDFNNDGLNDIFIPNDGLYKKDLLLFNQGNLVFLDVTENLNQGTAPRLSYHSDAGDIDNDGDIDIFVANPTIDESSRFYENLGNGIFRNSTDKIPELTDAVRIWLSDLDNDGDLDIFLCSSDLPSKVLINELIPTVYSLKISAMTGGTTDPVPGDYTYIKGTEAAITAIPDIEFRFSGWTGEVPSGHESDNPTTIMMDSDKSVTANFIRQHVLTIATEIGGTTDPTPGSYIYDSGTEVTVEAINNSGYEFSGWGGNVSGITNPITLTMDSDKSITAKFRVKPDVEEKKGPCFIATAAYGSSLHPYVEILRDFRDKYLVSNKLGRVFVDLYYEYSPYIATLIAKHKVLRVVVRINLLPLIAFSYLMLHFGTAITTAFLALIFVLPIFFVCFYQKRIK